MDSPCDTARSGGLPHSEIRGSTGARPSPRLFAACHVLHRLSVPRHPPDALHVPRPRPTPSTRSVVSGQATVVRHQPSSASRPRPRLGIAAQTSAPADARAPAYAYPCPGPISSREPPAMMTGPASRSRLASRFQKGRDQRSKTRGRIANAPARAARASDIAFDIRFFRTPFR